jgi:hypothetical protein
MGAQAAARHTALLIVIEDLLWMQDMTNGGGLDKKIIWRFGEIILEVAGDTSGTPNIHASAGTICWKPSGNGERHLRIRWLSILSACWKRIGIQAGRADHLFPWHQNLLTAEVLHVLFLSGVDS